MLRNSNKPSGFSVNPGNSALRWRSVFIALVLALSIGSAGKTLTAQAAPAGATELAFFMVAVKEGGSRTLCIGELAHVDVLVYREKVINGVSEAPDAVTGIRVNALVTNRNVGKISPERNTTIWASSIYPGAADFVFTAENIGETQVDFEATVVTPGWFGTNWGGGSRNVFGSIDVRVIPCKVKVTTISRASSGPYNLEGTGDEAEVVADAQGNFKGSTTVNWEDRNTSSCVFSLLSLSPSQVDWSGTIDSDQLVLTGTFQPTTTSYSFTCPSNGGSVSGQGTSSNGPLTIRVALTGGASTQAQMVANAAGSAVIVVIPEKCGGTASC
jgi:hypothetical protein